MTDLSSSSNMRASEMPDTDTQGVALDVDVLAQEIRRVDGNNELGAGALAEAIMPFLHAYLSAVSGEARDDGQGATVERLRNLAKSWAGPFDEAADRIEALTRENAALRATLTAAKAGEDGR